MCHVHGRKGGSLERKESGGGGGGGGGGGVKLTCPPASPKPMASKLQILLMLFSRSRVSMSPPPLSPRAATACFASGFSATSLTCIIQHPFLDHLHYAPMMCVYLPQRHREVGGGGGGGGGRGQLCCLQLRRGTNQLMETIMQDCKPAGSPNVHLADNEWHFQGIHCMLNP